MCRGPLADGHRSLAGADFFHLAQSGAGDHKGEGLGPINFIHSLPAQGQPVAVHRHHGEPILIHLKQGAGVDGAALVVADGEQGLGNHGTQHALFQGKGVLLVNSG